MHGAAGWRVYAILCDVKPILSGHPIPDFDQPQGVIGVAKIEIRNHLTCLEEKSERAKQPNKQNGQRKSPARRKSALDPRANTTFLRIRSVVSQLQLLGTSSHSRGAMPSCARAPHIAVVITRQHKAASNQTSY